MQRFTFLASEYLASSGQTDVEYRGGATYSHIQRPCSVCASLLLLIWFYL